MKHITIKTVEALKKYDFSNIIITEDVQIDITLRCDNIELDYPINIKHFAPGFTSKVNIKLALFGNTKINMPVEILVENGAINTSTHFKALVLIMSPNSRALVTPGLLIHEKNIQAASHGVVIKNIKDKDLVYLQSRGMEKEQAKEVMVSWK